MNLWRLEYLRLLRTYRVWILLGIFGFFAVLGPATAKYLPEIVERFGRRFWCAADLDFPRRLTPRNGSSNVFSRSSEPPRLRV